MSALEAVGHQLAPTLDPDVLASRHVLFDEHTSDATVEGRIVDGLLGHDRPRILVTGAAGAGKSSAVSKAMVMAVEAAGEGALVPRPCSTTPTRSWARQRAA